MRLVLSTVEEMLDPEVVSEALGRPVKTVERLQFVPKGFSSTGARFEGVRIDGDVIPSLVVKTVDRVRDWVAVATTDKVDREVSAWESGLLDLLPSDMDHAVVAGARFPGGSSILMRNRAEEFLTEDEPITSACYARVLQSLGSMHAAYWQHPILERAGSALCGLEQVLGHLAPARLPALRRAVPDHFIIAMIEEGWAGLAEQVGAGLADDLRSLTLNPAPVLQCLAGFPQTLVHGDVRPANVAFRRSGATLVDWARPTAAPPGIDLAYLLLMSASASPVSPDEAVAFYRKILASSLGADGSWPWWGDHVDVCMTAVFAMMAAFVVNREIHDAAQEDRAHARITWWAERAAPGLRIIERC